LAEGQPEATWQREELGRCFLLPAKIYYYYYLTLLGCSPLTAEVCYTSRLGHSTAGAGEIQGNAFRVTYNFTSSLISSDTEMGLVLLSFSLNEETHCKG